VPWTWTDSLALPKQWKKDMSFGNWNVRSLCRVGAIKSVVGDFTEVRVVTGEKNSPTVAHACRKRRLKWVLPRSGLEHRASNPVPVKNFTATETSTIVKLLRPYVPVGTKRTRRRIS
jgi:hypothetical protein